MVSLDSELLRFWERVSEIGFIAVIIGVMLEVAELCAKWYERCKAKRFPKKLHRWILPIETLGFSILVIGLAVEFLGSHKAMQIADRQNSVLAKDAAEGNRLAGVANERASSNELQVAQLIRDNLILRSNEAELELKTQWRTITPEQETNLIHVLSPVSNSLPNGQKSVLVMAEGADNPETQRYANRIADVLKNCGFEAVSGGGLRIGTTQFGVMVSEGVLIQVKDRTNPPPHAIPILKAFQTLNIKSLRAEQNRDTKEGLVVIRVLPKPEG